MKFICLTARNFTTYIKVGGKEKRINFASAVCNGLDRGQLVTNDVALCNALKKDKRYKKEWICTDDELKTNPEEGTEQELEKYVVSSIAEAKQFLVEKGYNNPLTSTNDCIEAAKSLGIQLEFAR